MDFDENNVEVKEKKHKSSYISLGLDREENELNYTLGRLNQKRNLFLFSVKL
jgi:hypothetical protein